MGGGAGAGESVLVLKPSSLGDIVHTLPAVARIKAARSDRRIAWLVNTEWTPLLQGNPDVDEVIAFPRGEFRGVGGWFKAVGWARRSLLGRRPELAVDFQGLLRSAVLARLSGARRIIGAADAREGAASLYHQVHPVPGAATHAVERYLALAGAAVGGHGAEQALGFPLPEGAPPTGGEGLEDYVLIHPFARGQGKSLTAAQVQGLCEMLAPRQTVLVGKTAESLPAVRNVRSFLNATSLLELIWLIRRAAFVISVDSGPMHLAAACGSPLIGIHSWTDPRKVGPYRPDAWVWKGGRLFQMRDLAETPPELLAGPAKALERRDLEAIGALA